jgi:hypothetical protein
VLPPLAAVEDLGVWMGSTIPTGSTPRAVAILAAASTLVRRFTGELWVNEDGDLDPGDDELRFESAAQVVVLVAERVYKNPDGRNQQTTGPFSHSVEAWSALGLALRDEEKEMLSPTAGVPGLGIISTTRGRVETRSVLCGYDYRSADPWYGDI